MATHRAAAVDAACQVNSWRPNSSWRISTCCQLCSFSPVPGPSTASLPVKGLPSGKRPCPREAGPAPGV